MRGKAIAEGRARYGCNRFTEQEIRVIRSRIERGDRLIDLAAEYDCYPPYMSLIKQRKVWKYLDAND